MADLHPDLSPNLNNKVEMLHRIIDLGALDAKFKIDLDTAPGNEAQLKAIR